MVSTAFSRLRKTVGFKAENMGFVSCHVIYIISHTMRIMMEPIWKTGFWDQHIRYPAPTNIRIDPSKWIEAWVFAHQSVCDWNGLHQIKTGNLIYGFPKMGGSNMWIRRGITTPLVWDLGFPTDNGSLHLSYGFPMVFLWFSDIFSTFHQGSPRIFWCRTWSSAASPRATSSPPVIRRQDRMTNMLPGRMKETKGWR